MYLSEKTKKAQLKLIFMKRTFPKTLFKWCSAFVLVGVLFSGCKKYDDDIDRLQESIDANDSAMSALDQLVKSGAVVQSVAQNDNGVNLFLSNGQKSNITTDAAEALGTVVVIEIGKPWCMGEG